VLSSEGGHIGLASTDELQYEFEQFSKKKFGLTNEFISAEWMICGKAISNIYEFFSIKEGKKLENIPTPKEVFSTIGSDPISRKAFEHFLKTLGTCLAHLGAAMLPDDGIFLSGSILTAVEGYLKEDVSKGEDSILLRSFTNNKCVGPYLKTVPLYFTSETDLGMKGCWNFLQLLSENPPTESSNF
jgi:glucokinase